MKLNYSKDWYETRIAAETELEIGVGIPPGCPSNPNVPSSVSMIDARIAFGALVALWRRNQGWDAEELAQHARVDPEEILEIERNPQCQPEPDAVHKLAEVFGLPSRPLLELAGLVQHRTPGLLKEAIRFAARSEPVAALNTHEREALEAFVAALISSTKEPK